MKKIILAAIAAGLLLSGCAPTAATLMGVSAGLNVASQVKNLVTKPAGEKEALIGNNLNNAGKTTHVKIDAYKAGMLTKTTNDQLQTVFDNSVAAAAKLSGGE